MAKLVKNYSDKPAGRQQLVLTDELRESVRSLIRSRAKKGITRAELREITGMSVSMTNLALKTLHEMKLIYISGVGRSTKYKTKERKNAPGNEVSGKEAN
jgi:hypothetical protein